MTTEHLPEPSFRELLRQHRQAAGLTQEALAEAAGLSTRGISDLERGARGYPHPETVRRLAAALNLDEATHAVFLQSAPRRPGSAAGSPTTPQGTFPIPMTSLVGRGAEIATIRRWVLEEGHRLVTLQGHGGMGKTRLVLAAAEQMASDFRDGAVFVDLAPVRDPGLLVPQFAAALGLQEQPGQSLQETLAAYLRPRQQLLVLDNFEQLLPAALIVAELLRSALELHVLVTSRAPLRIQGERLFQVPPLGHLDAGNDDLEAARASDAVTLFVARAQAVQTEFALTEVNAVTVLAICRRLEGMPLALELAAARTGILPLTTLRDRLSASLPLLTSGPRDAPARHQTLRDAIAWSEELLEPPVRTFFHRLGVFVGGWTLEAAEAVAARDGTLDVVDGLAALGDLHLIRAVAGDDEPRYRMLETIREFAHERLTASPDAVSVTHAHAAYYSGVAECGAQHLTGGTQGEWLRRLDVEVPNVRAALQTLAADEDGDAYLSLAANLGDYWFRRSHFAEGRAHLEAALARDSTPSLPRAAALLWIGALAFGQAEFAVADRWLAQCETMAQSLDASSLLYDALFWRGVVTEQMGPPLHARSFFASALTVARQLEDATGIGSALNALCLLDLHRGEPGLAEQWVTEAIPYLLTVGDAFELSVGFANMGEVALARGEVARAQRAYEDALAHARSSDVAWLFANALVGFAALAAARRDNTTAALLLGACDTVRAESLHLTVPSYVLHTETMRRVRAALSESDYREAWNAGQALSREAVLAYIQHTGS
jgi:predicted ATPase/transcriptional regulator with XRE-family HTH domain